MRGALYSTIATEWQGLHADWMESLFAPSESWLLAITTLSVDC
jgi:hypothetical protein